MDVCKHERLRCTNNVYYCLNCGAVVPLHDKTDKNPPANENAPEGQKRAAKRKTKKTLDE